MPPSSAPPPMPSVLAPPSTRSSKTPQIVSFDPSKAPTPPDDDEQADDIDNRRIKKRKSAPNLRGASSAASSSKQPPIADPEDDDDDDDKDKNRRKIQIEYIEDKSKRHITFSKRKAGIMKKAYELSTLTGTQVLLLVVSESGWVYTFTTDKFKPMVKEDDNGQLSAGQKLIASCLEAKEEESPVIAQNPAFQPTAHNANFEANSAIHGGQISIKPTPRAMARPTATNRRVSGKGRVPAAIRTGPEQSLPPLPNLPMPMSAPPVGSYLDPGIHSPLSPRGAHRSMSHPPISPHHPSYGQLQMQQAEYAEMMRNEQHQYDHGYDSVYGGQPGTPGSMPPHSMSMMAMHDGMPDSYHHGGPSHEAMYASQQMSQSHYTHHPDPNGPLPHQLQQHRGSVANYAMPNEADSMPPQAMGQQPVYGHDEGAYTSR
ncbi:hypothetical protein OIO90_000530 [Microbotryomycetes sp. JL221]|nr:hypothetical protein OIO90_000530 [Microbotryomycetes sp. JL221]